MLTESLVEGKSVEEKDAQPTERTAALWGLQNQFKNLDWGWGQGIKSTTLEVCTGSKLKPEPGPYPRSSDPTRPERHS